jgi:hypothetical protein
MNHTPEHAVLGRSLLRSPPSHSCRMRARLPCSATSRPPSLHGVSMIRSIWPPAISIASALSNGLARGYSSAATLSR